MASLASFSKSTFSVVGSAVAIASLYSSSVFESFFDFPNNPTLVDHKKILKSLIDKNELRAVELMKAHIMFSMESLKNVDK